MKNQATRLIRLPEVLERTGYGKAWIYRLINDGKFPAPVKIGSRAIAFVGNDSNLLIVFYVQIMPDDFVMQLHRF
ncbi:helix-turn-helix transcriptional regulator [Escherichia coli]|uniref:helix-turn-helix transcriptional regulator n=1 Tax=Escherichia coli TaxID=562 RepID=UPI00050BA901|nr:AlpA family transcriptional regulator [Escherichia coli]